MIRRGQAVTEFEKRRVEDTAEPQDKPQRKIKTETPSKTSSTATPTRTVINLSDVSDLSDEEEETGTDTAILSEQLANVTAERDALLTQLTAMAAVAKRACREYKATIQAVKDVSSVKQMKDTYKSLFNDFRAAMTGMACEEAKIKEEE